LHGFSGGAATEPNKRNHLAGGFRLSDSPKWGDLIERLAGLGPQSLLLPQNLASDSARVRYEEMEDDRTPSFLRGGGGHHSPQPEKSLSSGGGIAKNSGSIGRPRGVTSAEEAKQLIARGKGTVLVVTCKSTGPRVRSSQSCALTVCIVWGTGERGLRRSSLGITCRSDGWPSVCKPRWPGNSGVEGVQESTGAPHMRATSVCLWHQLQGTRRQTAIPFTFSGWATTYSIQWFCFGVSVFRMSSRLSSSRIARSQL